MPKEFLTVNEVAKILGVTPLTVRNWDNKGKLTAHRHPLNNYRVYKVNEIENLIKDLEASKGVKRTTKKTQDKPIFKKLKIDVL